MRRALLPTLLSLIALAGCGGGDDSGPAPTSGPGKVFAQTCGGCHTFKAAGAGGSLGPNLDKLKPDAARVLTAIAEGPGSMPAGLLKGAEADEVAAYVADMAGK